MRRQTNKSNNKEEEKGKNLPQKIKNELTEEQKREIKDAFSSFEEEVIEPDELKSAMQSKGPLKYNDFLNVMIDNDEDKVPENEMKKAFKILCEEGSDKITLKSLSKICTDLGEKISEEELQEMILEADKDQDEEVGDHEFLKIMQKTGMF